MKIRRTDPTPAEIVWASVLIGIIMFIVGLFWRVAG